MCASDPASIATRSCAFQRISHVCVLMPMWASGCLCACPYAVTSAVTKETPWGGEEVPKGVRHGEERHVVHSLSLEKSLSEIHRLIRSTSRVHEMSSSSLGMTARWTLPLRRRRQISSGWSSQCCFLQPSMGFAFSLFRFQIQREKIKPVGKNKQTKQTKKISKKKKELSQVWRVFLRLKHFTLFDEEKQNF